MNNDTEEQPSDGERTTELQGTDSEASRRRMLKRFGTTGLGIGAGLSSLRSAVGVASAHANDSWDESRGTYGRHEDHDDTDNSYYFRYVDWDLRYHGWEATDYRVLHHFHVAQLCHTFYGTEDLYSAPDPQSGYQQTYGSELYWDNNDSDVNVLVDPDDTYPAFVDVSGGTDPNWTEVVEENDDSWDDYQGAVEDEANQLGVLGAKAFSFAAEKVAVSAIGALTGVSGVGTAISLASLVMNAEDQECIDEQEINGGAGYRFKHCSSYGEDYVPLNWHHADLVVEVDKDGWSHYIDLYQKVLPGDDDLFGSSSHVKWDLRLPGYEDAAEVTDSTLL